MARARTESTPRKRAKLADCLGIRHVFHFRSHFFPGGVSLRAFERIMDRMLHGTKPVMIIDWREIPWWQFGRMLMTFEGFQFKLEIRDPSEEF